MNGFPTFRVEITENDRVVFDGSKEHRLLEKTPKAAYFYDVENPTKVRHVQLSDLDDLIRKPKKFRLESNYYDLENIKLRAHSVLTLPELSPAASAGVHHRYTLAMEWRRALNCIPLNTPDRDQIALDKVYLDIALRFARGEVRSTLSLKDKPVNVDTIRKWNARLRAHNDDPACLIDGRNSRSGNKSKRFSADEERFIDQAILDYLSPNKPSIKKVWLELDRKAKTENASRKGTMAPFVRRPCYQTLKRRIAKVSRFIVRACRNGIAVAEKEFRASFGGQGFARPGQRLEVDGWLFHLHSLFENSPAWEDLSDEIRAKLKTVRITFIVVIDTATRSIVGINFSWSENAAAVTAALHMAMQDKSELAKQMGCASAWPQYGWGNFVHDGAAAYDEAELVTKVLKGLSSNQKSVAGVPWLRGTIEAFFKVIIGDLLIAFTGQTGSNPFNRTAFQDAINASISFNETVEQSFKWIVENYHNTRHDDLGMTPLAAWHRFSELSPPPPRHGPVKLIEIFGQRFERTVGKAGISLAGSQFQSPELQHLRRLIPGTKVETWMDCEDLGQILVRVPEQAQGKLMGHLDGWLLVPGPAVLSGISLRHIDMVDDDLAVRFGFDGATSEQRAADFKAGLAQFARDAAHRRLTEAPLSLEKIEKRLAKSYHHALGDDHYREEHEAIHAPILLAKGPIAQTGAEDPASSIDVEFEI